MMSDKVVNHLKLGHILGLVSKSNPSFMQLSLPYGQISQRFARASILSQLPKSTSGAFDARKPGATSIQPFGSVKTDAKGNQLPTEGLPDDEPQAEDCLNLTITAPSDHIDKINEGKGEKLPVVVFLHGGAFFVGAGSRPYYNPLTFCNAALQLHMPFLFVAVNYRLGALGFFHSSSAPTLVPENNGLHDQLTALSWIKQNISGFGGDLDNMTIIGQSAGAESISLQSLSTKLDPVPYQKAIMFSGTPVTMPSKTPQEHEENFLEQAGKLEIKTEGKSSTEIAEEMIKIDVSKIRELSFVGAPCSSSTTLPYPKPTMSLAQSGSPKNPTWAKSQIISATTYDGGISYNMTSSDSSRKDHGKVFSKIIKDALSPSQATRLSEIYDMKEDDPDPLALQKICQFESDIGFINAAVSLANGGRAEQTYFQLFDLGNPFEGPLEKSKFATHTWDIVALLGAFEEGLSEEYKSVIKKWREKIIRYICTGEDVCAEWDGEKGKYLLVDCEGVNGDKGFWNGEVGQRISRLRDLAKDVGGDEGADFLWEGVGRRFLMKGE